MKYQYKKVLDSLYCYSMLGEKETMIFDTDLQSELNVLTQFNLKNEQDGIKIHHEAAPEMLSAVARLHDKGIVTQADGGYLTDLGRKAAEHAQDVFTILK